jgi:membrane-bound lytic murein transglycosylase B
MNPTHKLRLPGCKETPSQTHSNTLTLLHYLFIFFFIFVAAQPSIAKPKASDLVTDGQPIDLGQEKYRQLFQELVNQHNFTTTEIQEIFAGLVIKKRVLELMEKPWEAKPYYLYAPLFLTEKNIATGRNMLKQHREILDRIEKNIGVNREIIIAIWGIETKYGANQGSFNVFQTLNTLFDAYPRRSKFFRKEMIHFLLLCKENAIDPKSVSGSYAGAFGQTQFIPSSFRAYAVSFDDDDKRDVWNSIPDILASIANYLKKHHWTMDSTIYWELGSELTNQQLVAAYLKGWRGRVSWKKIRETQAPDIPKPPGKGELSIVGLELPKNAAKSMRYIAGFPNFQAITHWNHSNRYAMAAVQLAEAISTEPVNGMDP